MGHWLADVHLAGFAPAFTLSFHDSECSRKPPNAHSLGRYVQQQKNKKYENNLIIQKKTDLLKYKMLIITKFEYQFYE